MVGMVWLALPEQCNSSVSSQQLFKNLYWLQLEYCIRMTNPEVAQDSTLV